MALVKPEDLDALWLDELVKAVEGDDAILKDAANFGESYWRSEWRNLMGVPTFSVRAIPPEEIFQMDTDKKKDTPEHPDRDKSGGTQPGGQPDPRDASGRQPAQSDPQHPDNVNKHDRNDIS